MEATLIINTLIASIESVANAAILAAMGWYLHVKGFMSKPGKKLLAEMSQNVTFPMMLFTSILYCRQDGGFYRGVETQCPNVLKTITASWIVLLWPFYTTAWGILIGNLMAKLSNAPKSFRCAAMAAVAFGNSTGLPITLVSIIHSAASPKSPLSETDPAIFLSIYLIFNPILQWSLGSWLLEAPEKEEDKDSNGDISYEQLSQTELVKVNNPLVNASSSLTDDSKNKVNFGSIHDVEGRHHPESSEVERSVVDIHKESKSNKERPTMSVGAIIFKQLAQPAIIASLCGLFIACINPLHDLLVDTRHKKGEAPLEFVFEAMHTVGMAAIPINMIMLGSTLTEGVKAIPKDFRWGPNLAVAFGKLVLQPLVATISVIVCHEVFPVHTKNQASLYFAMLIVTCTPTANNINVMAEVGGVNKDTMALCILTQYVFAAVTVTVWVTVFQYLVKDW